MQRSTTFTDNALALKNKQKQKANALVQMLRSTHVLEAGDDDDKVDEKHQVARAESTIQNNDNEQVEYDNMAAQRRMQSVTQFEDLMKSTHSRKSNRQSKNLLERSSYQDDSQKGVLEPADEEQQAIIQMLSERINDQEIEDEVENLNDILGEAADINKMNRKVEALKKQNEQFVITLPGKNQHRLFDYQHDDRIFFITGPQSTNKVNAASKCNCCQDPFKNYKEAKCCSFCAQDYCAKCRTKTRQFPASAAGRSQSVTAAKEKQLSHGDICIVCDRKFYIRDMLTELILQIEAQTKQLLGPKGLSKQMEDSRQKMVEIRRQFERDRRAASLDYQRICIHKDTFSGKIMKAQKEQDESQKRVQESRQKYNDLETEIQEIGDEIVRLKDELLDVNEEISQLNNRTLLKDQEYRRTELALQEIEAKLNIQDRSRQPPNPKQVVIKVPQRSLFNKMLGKGRRGKNKGKADKREQDDSDGGLEEHEEGSLNTSAQIKDKEDELKESKNTSAGQQSTRGGDRQPSSSGGRSGKSIPPEIVVDNTEKDNEQSDNGNNLSMSFTRGGNDSMVFEGKNTLRTLASGETGEASSLKIASDNPLFQENVSWNGLDDGPLGAMGLENDRSADRLDTRESDIFNGSQMARSLGSGSMIDDVKTSVARSRQSTTVEGRDYLYAGGGAFTNYQGIDVMAEMDAKSEHYQQQAKAHLSNSTDHGRNDNELAHSQHSASGSRVNKRGRARTIRPKEAGGNPEVQGNSCCHNGSKNCAIF